MSTETIRQFRVNVDGLTLPGAGMQPGVVSGRPFAHAGETVTEDELGDHILELIDAGDPRTLRLLTEIEPLQEEDDEEADDQTLAELNEGSDVEPESRPFEDYDSLNVAQITERLQAYHEAGDEESIKRVKDFEALQKRPRSGVLNFEPGGGE
jgi:hypothetical protein